MLSWSELFVMGALGVILVLWVLLPLVPAIIIYKRFPTTPVAVKGLLAGFTVNMGGAFAAYFIVLLAVKPVLEQAYDFAGSMLHPAWTIKGSLLLVGKDGRPWHPGDQFTQNIYVRTMPVTTDFQDVAVTPDENARGSFIFTVPEVSQQLPIIFLRTVNGQVAVTMELDEVDRFRKTAVMKKPIRIDEPTLNNSDDRRAQTIPVKN
jgi:hypothetical protein